MTDPTQSISPDAAAFVSQRRTRLASLLQRRLRPPPASDLLPDRRRFLFEEAEELYWNELSWEKLTEDEGVEKGGFVELAFPGFLAFVDGLLLTEVPADSLAPASPRPEVVEDILLFLAGRCLGLADETDPEAVLEREVTLRLIDLVLYRQHGLAIEDVEGLERAGADEEE